MKNFLLNLLRVLSFVAVSALAQISPSTATSEQLDEIGKQRMLQLQSAIARTEEMTAVNAKSTQAAFTDCLEFIDLVVMRKDLSDADKLKAVGPVAESIAAAFGDLAQPFTDFEEARGGANIWEKGLEQIKAFGLFWWQQVNFSLISWFRPTQQSERPPETIRRTKIGKALFESVNASIEKILRLNSPSTNGVPAELSEFQVEMLNNYGKMVSSGIRSEPYKYKNLTRGVTLTVAMIAGFYALSPRALQEALVILPPLDMFPPFTFMDRTLLSPIVARGLWLLYGSAGFLLPRITTGYSLGSAIEKTRNKFREIRKQHGSKVGDCELAITGPRPYRGDSARVYSTSRRR